MSSVHLSTAASSSNSIVDVQQAFIVMLRFYCCQVLKGNRPEVPRFGIPYEIKDLIKKSWDQQHLLRPSFQEIVEVWTLLN